MSPFAPQLAADYPAGHSMDSTWFAVDEAGQVAFFDTGEGGAVPVDGFPCGGEAGGYEQGLEASNLIHLLLSKMAKQDAELAEVVPRSLHEMEEFFDCEDEQLLLQSLGLWVYECDEVDAFPYVRRGSPSDAIAITDLPSSVRRRFSPGSLPLRFSERQEVAPGEHGEVATWSRVWFDTQGQPHAAEAATEKDLVEARAHAKEHKSDGPAVAESEALDRDGILALLRERSAQLQEQRRARAERGVAMPPPSRPRFWARLFGKK